MESDHKGWQERADSAILVMDDEDWEDGMGRCVLIIGAGISGLSAGCYARMNGYDAEIHEAHTLPGGLSTAWKRGGYVIDGCISWLLGSGPGNHYYDIYQELGLIQGRRMYDFYLFASVTGRDGRTVRFYTDLDRLEAFVRSRRRGGK